MNLSEKINQSQVLKQSGKSRIILANIEDLKEKIIIKELDHTLYTVYKQLSGIQNQHFPDIYQVEQTESHLLVAEEYIEGKTIAAILSERTFSLEEAIDIMLQICSGMVSIHYATPPIIHMDLTPWNLLLTQEHLLKIIDFDAARIYKPGAACDTRRLGTAEYAPPEQFGFSQTDARSDIYSMGVLLYELVYCKSFHQTGPSEFIENRKYRKINKIINRCTMFSPSQRYQSIEELKRALLLSLPFPLRYHYCHSKLKTKKRG